MVDEHMLVSPLFSPDKGVEWEINTAYGSWLGFFLLGLEQGILEDKLNMPETEQILSNLDKSFSVFEGSVDEVWAGESSKTLEIFVNAVILISQQDYERCPKEFKAYVNNGCKSSLSYQQAKLCLQQGKNFFFPFINRVLTQMVRFLNDLRRLRRAVSALYELADPQRVLYDKPLSAWYKEFKDHYAYETVFGFIMF